MNDDLIVINAYPNNIEREIILENCIQQFKKTNKEILLVSHYPIKIEIQQLVDYFIYDIRNDMLDESMLYWYANEDFYLQTSAFEFGSASYAVLLSIQNAVYLAKSLGKKIFYYFEYDCLISDQDLKKIELLRNKIYHKGKKGYVQVIDHGGDLKNKGVGLLFFMFEIDFYVKTFKIIKTPEEYKKSIKNGVALEFYFYQNLLKNISEIYVEEDIYIREFFSDSELNLSSYEATHFIDILPERKSRKSILTLTNPKSTLREYKIVFLKNDNVINEVEISVYPGGYYYNILSEEIKNIHVFYKENNNWKLVYDKKPSLEVKNKNNFEYAKIG